MRRGSRVFYGVAVAVVAAVVVLALNAVYGFFNSSTTSGGAQRTATVAVGTVQSSVSASGNVSAAQSASVDFGTSGTLTSVGVAVGDRVKAGQVLGTIDPTSAQTTLESASANLAQAESALATTQSGLTDAQKASNASSLLQAQSTLATDRQQLATDEVAVVSAKQQLARDRALGCPPAGTTSSSSSAGSSSSGSGAASASSSSAGSSTSSGTGSSSSGTSAGRGTPAHGVNATPGSTTTAGAGSSEPSVTTGQGSNVGSATATLSGTVGPSGAETTYRFEYGTSASSLSSSTAELGAGSGAAVVSVTASLTGLKPGRTYYFQLVATNAAGTASGAEVSFTTLAAAKPTVTTASASNVLTTTATLNGSINPNGSDTKYRFEYGTTAAYSLKTAVVDAGSGTTAVQVSAAVTGLKPDTAYLFRLVATNNSGTSKGIGQIGKSAQSSCAADAATITSAEQTVAQQRVTVTSAEASLTQTKATIAASEKPSAATIAQDEATVRQNQATVAAAQAAVEQTTLKAPISGTITAVNGAVGATVSGNGSSVSRGASSSAASPSGAGNGSSSNSSPFATIDSLNKLEIVSGFAEADATKLAAGQPATITFPALTNTEVAGKVVAVSSTSTVVSNVVTYNVTIILINPPPEVKEGMTASVSVVDQTRSHVLQLPTSAITTSGRISTVQLLQNGKTTVTPVTTGLVGDSSTEILSGLKRGDVVVIPTVAIAAASSSTPTTGAGGFGGGGGGGFGRGGFGGITSGGGGG